MRVAASKNVFPDVVCIAYHDLSISGQPFWSASPLIAVRPLTYETSDGKVRSNNESRAPSFITQARDFDF